MIASAEDIMNHHAPQGMHVEAAVLAYMSMDLYIPPQQANAHRAKALRASQHAAIHRRHCMLHLCTTMPPVIGEECFIMPEWSDPHDAISVDY